ncbi:MAG TPA: shikimate kinase [Chitinophagaceae bacterium]|nr:shikimate kinase [Chitinophagaceae bacterium]
MGSGKTHWGKIWAKNNGLQFFDLDTRIEDAAGMSITKIFEKHGEDKFREMEAEQLKKFAHLKNFILACGGGTPCFGNNMEWMKANGKVIYLKASPSLIVKNVLDEMEQRPIIKDVNPSELIFFVERKLKERESFYSQADYTLNVERLNDNALFQLFNNTNANA